MVYYRLSPILNAPRTYVVLLLVASSCLYTLLFPAPSYISLSLNRVVILFYLATSWRPPPFQTPSAIMLAFLKLISLHCLGTVFFFLFIYDPIGSHAFMLHFTYMHMLLWSMTPSYIPHTCRFRPYLFRHRQQCIHCATSRFCIFCPKYNVRGQPITDFTTFHSLAIGASISHFLQRHTCWIFSWVAN